MKIRAFMVRIRNGTDPIREAGNLGRLDDQNGRPGWIDFSGVVGIKEGQGLIVIRARDNFNFQALAGLTGVRMIPPRPLRRKWREMSSEDKNDFKSSFEERFGVLNEDIDDHEDAICAIFRALGQTNRRRLRKTWKASEETEFE